MSRIRTILVADDEKELVDLIKLYLEVEGYRVMEASNGQEALDKLQEYAVDLVILDIVMPLLNGFQLVKTIRESANHIPVIFLSASVQDHDKILGLQLGADDYMTKPFNPMEVVARVQAQLRRNNQFNDRIQPKATADIIRVGELMLNTKMCQLEKRGGQVHLTAIEYKLLLALMEHPGKVYTKKQLYENVWGDFYSNDDNTIMVCISKLRDKIEDDPKKPKYITTIRGLGYKFVKSSHAT
ncbi:response regulator transcription factor [Paenibacillus tyrfis]|uniref:response regulator transcription factor n=1 Tax=Paenibacillus tyrfis TaxID=1501230 RepID=UPI0020A16066|nr:response regulator transcription factor [Paenibacillus tyrfis]MCP1312403.1 response regulator transcription factor [Paenibacillus tyrfis]